MQKLQKVYDYEFWHENKIASVFLLENGVKIIGFTHGKCFDLRVLTVGSNPRGKGLGRKALKYLRKKFKRITVSHITKEALPFWLKMKERGLIDELVSVKDGTDLYLLNQTAEERLKKFFAVSSRGQPGRDQTHGKARMREQENCWSGINYAHSPIDPEWEHVCAI